MNSTLRNSVIALCLFMPFFLYAQISFNANTQAPPAYTGTFRMGMNMGSGYATYNTDELLADLSFSTGARTVRASLPESFTTQWGYNIRVPAFNHYKNIGMLDITCMVGIHTTPNVRAPETYICGPYVKQSVLFRDMYLPIWDGGANGTPYNDNNPYAVYLYNVVNTYKSSVKFWEIWNEPGFDYSNKGWRPPGDISGNWWDNNPDPCDYKLQAPIFQYIRMLRISYEIVKYLDPTAFVGPSSCGYPSFLDALLRNTDNPIDGSVTPDYPLKAGAYFDVICHHSYPHFDGSVRRNTTTWPYVVYSRHTDMAADGIEWVLNTFDTVYTKRGYDGVTYPKKKWVLTECNLPRVALDPNSSGERYNWGSNEVQRNFWAKAWVKAAKIGVLQIHPYGLVETRPVTETPTYEFDNMGMFTLGADGNPKDKTDGALALTTTTLQLHNKRYDAAKTAAMLMPPAVQGAAFVDNSGNYTYVIWAKTTIDGSENASATYSFPASFNIATMTKREWSYSITNLNTAISSRNIALTGAPIFLTVVSTIPVELVSFSGKVQGNTHLLEWKTASELNADYFEVEKSEDGLDFTPLSKNAKIKAIGNTSTPQYYSTIDDNVTVGMNYYRLKMVDKDGKENHSNIIALESTTKLSAKVAPNPFDKSILIDLHTALEKEQVMIELIDVSGKVLIKNKIETTGKSTEWVFDTEGVPSGMYILRLSNKSGVLQKKIVKY